MTPLSYEKDIIEMDAKEHGTCLAAAARIRDVIGRDLEKRRKFGMYQDQLDTLWAVVDFLEASTPQIKTDATPLYICPIAETCPKDCNHMTPHEHRCECDSNFSHCPACVPYSPDQNDNNEPKETTI